MARKLYRCANCGKEIVETELCSQCRPKCKDGLVFIGHMTCFEYDYTIVTKTRTEAEQKLLAEWKRQVREAGTQNDFDVPFSKINFEWLNEWNGSRVEATVLGKINRP